MKNKREEKNLKTFKVHKETPLLEFLYEHITNDSKNNIKKLLSRRQVLVDGAPVTQFDFMLSKDDVVMISNNPVEKIEAPKGRQTHLDIIYEDEDFIAINKPSGLLSVPSDNERSITAYRLMMDYVTSKNKHSRVYVLHRIDKETSGVLVACKSEAVRNKLQKDWNDNVISRGYYAVVEGILDKKEGDIQSWLRKAPETNLMYSAHKPGDGKLAITHYKVIREGKDYSLLDVHIDSGRKNQIRVHMKDIGHNVIGDTSYGSTKDPIQRLGLHAYELVFKNPINGNVMRFSAKMPSEFTALLNRK